MSLENAEVVDGAGLDKTTGDVILTISDHLTWEDEETHFRLIELKLGKYLDFIRSGQISESFPQATQAHTRIQLIYKYTPGDSGLSFLAAAQRQLASLGIAFSHCALPPGY